jgi:hypothetical protein
MSWQIINTKWNRETMDVIGGGEMLHYTKWTLIIVGLIVLVMGIAGLPGVSDMGTEPDWHAVLKIIIGVVAIAVPFLDRHN